MKIVEKKHIRYYKILFGVVLISVIISNNIHSRITEASTELILFPIEDTYVSQYEPDANYGASLDIVITSSDNMLNKVAFLKFDLSQIPSDATNIDANLFVWMISKAYDSPAQDIIALYCPDTTWQELKLTWNTRPNYDTMGWKEHISQFKTWYSFNVDSVYTNNSQLRFVSRALQSNSDKRLSIALVSNTTTNDSILYFPSKEQTSMKTVKTYLKITYRLRSPLIEPSITSGGIPSNTIEATLIGILCATFLIYFYYKEK